MPTTSDRSAEWSILRTVYSEWQCDRAVHADLPDFIMSDGAASSRWGVEVTEMFRSESQARLLHHPEYLGQLFAGGGHMHRDDRQTLRVETVVIHHQDGTEQESPAIVTANEPPSVRYERPAEIIRAKSGRPYQSGLHHLNLIVRDHYGVPGTEGEPLAVTHLMAAGVRPALLASPFREVYWATASRSGPLSVYRPLRLLMMMEGFYLFGHALNEVRPAEQWGLDEVSLLFADYCHRSQIDVRLWQHRGQLWVLHHGTAVGVSSKGLELFDSRDLPVPEEQIRDLAPSDPALSDDELATVAAHVAANGFSADFFMTVDPVHPAGEPA